MAIQLYNIAKLSDKTGNAAYRKIITWSRIDAIAERKDEPFPSRNLSEVTNFVESFRKNLTTPSMLHFVEFLDTWSIGFEQLIFLKHFSSFVLVKSAGAFSFGAYRLPDKGALNTFLKKHLRRRHMDQESRMFALNLLETARAYDTVCPMATIIIIRKPLTGSFSDQDLIHASKSKAPWINL